MCTLLPRNSQSGACRADTVVVAAVAVLAMFGTGLVLAYWLPQVVALGIYIVIRGREIRPAAVAPGTGQATVGARE